MFFVWKLYICVNVSTSYVFLWVLLGITLIQYVFYWFVNICLLFLLVLGRSDVSCTSMFHYPHIYTSVFDTFS
jgi:hypothetical protein